MQRILLAGLSLALASTVTAQGLSQPKGYETTSGGWYSYYAGMYADGRLQFGYGGHQGSGTLQVVTRLQFRRETYAGTSNYGRTWSNVSLTVADMDFTKRTDTWTDNQISPVQVFSASCSWPDTLGKPTVAPWGSFSGSANDHGDFPFKSTWIHNGKWGFSADFEYSGGVLANNGTWGTAANLYYHDGIAAANTSTEATGTIWGNTACVYTGQTTAAYWDTWLFADHVPPASSGNKQFRWQFYTYYNAKSSKNCIGLISVFGNSTGFGTLAGSKGPSCEQLFIDPSKPFFVWPHVTDADGHWFSQFFTAPFTSAWVGASIWSQSVADDSAAGDLQMSRAVEEKVPSFPTATPEFGQRLYYPDKTRDVGYGPYDSRIPVIYLKQ
jgi:hypothetical protein